MVQGVVPVSDFEQAKECPESKEETHHDPGHQVEVGFGGIQISNHSIPLM